MLSVCRTCCPSAGHVVRLPDSVSSAARCRGRRYQNTHRLAHGDRAAAVAVVDCLRLPASLMFVRGALAVWPLRRRREREQTGVEHVALIILRCRSAILHGGDGEF